MPEISPLIFGASAGKIKNAGGILEKKPIRCDVCYAEMEEKINLISSYIKVVKPCLQHEGAIRLRRFQRENIIIRLYSYFEHFLICAFYQAMIARKDLVKAYYAGKKDKRKRIKKILNDRYAYQELWSYATALAKLGEPEILIEAFKHFYGFDLFKNTDIKQIILDFRNVRNVLIHHSGLPNQLYTESIKTEGVVVDSNIRRVYGKDVLHAINLTDEFITSVLNAIIEIMFNIQQNIY